jgi:hypothetical protein
MDFSKKELNQIIHTLRTRASHVFGKCGSIFTSTDINEAHLVAKDTKLIPKNSASLTDVVLSQAEIGSGKDKLNFNVALKMWFGWDKAQRLRDRIYKECDKMPGKCSDKDKKDILNALILPEDSAGVSTEDLFSGSINKLKDVNNTVSLTYEARLYKYITENIIMRNVSPNFVPIFSASSCDVSEMIDIFEKNAFKGSDRIVTKLKFINKVFGDTVTLNFIITGSGHKMVKFKEVLEDLNLTSEEAGNVIFQAMYAFYIMDKYNIFHGDLHAENLFVQILDSPVNLSFSINGRNVRFATKYIFKVYDFDRGYLEDLGPNSKNDDYTESGMDNSMRRNIDFAHFLCICVRHEIERKGGLGSRKPFTDALNAVGLGEIALLEYGEKPLSDDIMGQCELHSVKLSDVSSKGVSLWLSANKDFARDYGTGRRFFRIEPSVLQTIILPAEYDTLTSVFNRDYVNRVVKRLLFRYEKDRKGIITLFVCRQWLCSPSNDINVSITDFFETDHLFDLLTTIVGRPSSSPRASLLEYAFPDISGKGIIGSEYTLNELFTGPASVVVPVVELEEPVPVKRVRRTRAVTRK